MDADDIRKTFAAFSRVTVRRMFGGVGIFADVSLLKTLNAGEIPGFLWLSEF
jgi:TfoX/Sxy family transcriptional regulator of competence genes